MNTCQQNLNNKTIIITNLYEGIPQTLILNLVAWVFLILLFTLLRQQAWDYGRLALVNSITGKRWTQIFYAHGNNQEILNSLSNEMIPPDRSPDVESPDTTNASRMQRQHSVLDAGFFSWIVATWRLRREQILRHSGPDACHYLSFQHHLIIVMAIITFVSIVIILPVNFMGTLSGDINSFSHTTIANLEPDSYLMWIHTTFAILFVPLVVLVMRRASGRNAVKVASTRTVMMTDVCKPDCHQQTIRNYLTQVFPDMEVHDVQLAYNIKELSKVAKEYESVIEARIYCEQHRGIKARPSCFTCDTVDALEFYKSEEQRLCGEVARLRSAAMNDPLGIAFVTVSSTSVAKQMIAHFRPSSVKDWALTYAPAPGDIFWENLSMNSAKWYIRWIGINSILFLFLFFITTPAYIVQIMMKISMAQNTTDPSEMNPSPLVMEFLPTLLLWSLTALMPIIVAYSESWLSHWTRSRENYAIMTKTFGYLLFMILILPSLGLFSASAFLEWSLSLANETGTVKFECIFLPDRGAFFVNYIITMSFIGTALELIRFPDLIMYIYRILTARSTAETPHIRKSIVIEFVFGIHYSWTVMIFTMATVYSLACPLITPFALIYLLLKNFNDKHNLYFAYGPSHMISQGGGKIHSTAVTMTKFSVVLLLIAFTGITYLRAGNTFTLRTTVLMVSLLSSLTLFGFMSPIKRCTTKPLTIKEDDNQRAPGKSFKI